MVEIPRAGTRLCLVRHGETEWNTQRRIQGQIDIGLNDTGRRQAEAAGRHLARRGGIAAVYSSDLKRAWDTAGRIASALCLEPRPVPALRERRYGIFEGLTYDEMKVRHPEGYAAFKERDPDYDFETGESLAAMYERVTAALRDIAAAHAGRDVVVVLHGGVLDIANRFVRGLPLDVPRDFLIPNAGLNWLACEDGAWRIETWAETGHLAAGALDELPS